MGGGKVTATFYVGDAVTVMNTLPEKSVDLILTSPPFLALRSYLPSDHPDKALEGGSQATPGAYIDWLLEVVEACARVLAPHGSLCFELGDTYSGSGGAGGDYAENGLREGQAKFRQQRVTPDLRRSGAAAEWAMNEGAVQISGGRGWPLAKSLSLIPESFRWAMVYGHNPHTGRKTEPWRLRNVIRWVRPNPPVGALGDKFRPATSELMVFCKAKDRFFDLDAVREPFTGDGVKHGSPSPELGQTIRKSSAALNERANEAGARRMPVTKNTHSGAPPLDWWNIPLSEGSRLRRPCEHGHYEPHFSGDSSKVAPNCQGGDFVDRSQAPLDWWNIPPGGYPGAHYAVWPPELLVKPIKAMCPEKVCRRCGEASRRITEVAYVKLQATNNATARGTTDGVLSGADPTFIHGRADKTVDTVGFTDCGHNDWRPGLVLDPFAGSGTTLAVATGHGRNAIGIDIDARNFDLALDRVGPLVLTQGEVAA